MGVLPSLEKRSRPEAELLASLIKTYVTLGRTARADKVLDRFLMLYPERDAKRLWQRADEFRGGHHPDVSSQDVVSIVEGDLVEPGDPNAFPEIVQRGIDGSIRCFAFDGEPGLALRRHQKINLPFVDVPEIMKSDAPTLLILQGVFQFQ